MTGDALAGAVDPNSAAVGVDLLGDGTVTEPDADAGDGFDPSEHTVDEVNAYLADHPDDAARILDAERAGKARTGILGSS